MGFNPIGSIALPYGRPGALCLSPRHGFKPDERAARCRSRSAWPHVADQGARGRTLPILQVSAKPLPGTASRPSIWEPPAAVAPVVCPIALETMSTLDLLGVSPIVSGVAQFLTYCAVAVLWAVAVADWLTADQPRQIRLLSSCGHSQASISRRLGVSRYQVRKVLA